MSTVGAAFLAVALPGGAAQAASLHLPSLLVRSGEMPGFVVRGAPEVATGAGQWVTLVEKESGSMARRDAQALRSAGFVAGAYENLGPKNGSTAGAGGSTVLLFKTAAEARRDVATQYSQGLAIQPTGAASHPLKLGIAGARGFTTPGSGPHPAAASNAYFATGRCLFVVGDFIDGTHPGTGPPVVTASKRVATRAAAPCR